MKESVLIFKHGNVYKMIVLGILFLLLLSIIVACDSDTPEPPSPTPILINIVQIQRTGVIVANVAVLRSGPGIDYERVGTLENGEDVKIVGKTTKGDWLLIEASGQEESNQVWVSSDFVSMELDNEEPEEDEPSEPLSPDTPTSRPTTTAIIIQPDTPTYTITSTLPAVSTPTFTATAAPATALPPQPPATGNENIMIVFDKTSAFVINITQRSIRVNGLVFNRIDNQGNVTASYQANIWGNFYSNFSPVQPSYCLKIALPNSSTAPDCIVSVNFETSQDQYHFWRETSTSRQFEVWQNNKLLQVCEISDGSCNVYVPQP
jgi:hypothetical protein